MEAQGTEVSQNQDGLIEDLDLSTTLFDTFEEVKAEVKPDIGFKEVTKKLEDNVRSNSIKDGGKLCCFFLISSN